MILPQEPTSGEQVLPWARAIHRVIRSLRLSTYPKSGIELLQGMEGTRIGLQSAPEPLDMDGGHAWQVYFPPEAGLDPTAPMFSLRPGVVYTGPGTGSAVSVTGLPSGQAVPPSGHWGWLEVTQDQYATVTGIAYQQGTPSAGLIAGYTMGGGSPNYIQKTYRPLFKVDAADAGGAGVVCVSSGARVKMVQLAFSNFTAPIWDINGYPARVLDPI